MTTSLPGQKVDLPPETVEAFGYRGDARFVGFFFSPMGDQLVATDGVNSGTGQTWAYLGYKRHRAVAPLLAPFDLGSSEEDAVHMLLIDRERNASTAPVAEARAFLQDQWPPPPPLTPEQQEAFEREFESCSRSTGRARSTTAPSPERWPSSAGGSEG